jgi:hypothetical protein
MTRFEDGEARGQNLELNRSPLFLRVVKGPERKWDALDQLEDTPSPEESVYVYVLVRDGGVVHLYCQDSKTRRRYCRWTTLADYRRWHRQPEDAVMRDQEAWQAWCRSEVASEDFDRVLKEMKAVSDVEKIIKRT